MTPMITITRNSSHTMMACLKLFLRPIQNSLNGLISPSLLRNLSITWYMAAKAGPAVTTGILTSTNMILAAMTIPHTFIARPRALSLLKMLHKRCFILVFPAFP